MGDELMMVETGMEKRFGYTNLAKGVAFVFSLVFLMMAVVSGFLTSMFMDGEVYTKSIEAQIEERFDEMGQLEAEEIRRLYEYNGEKSLDIKYADSNVRITLYNNRDKILYSNYNEEEYRWSGVYIYGQNMDLTTLKVYVIGELLPGDAWYDVEYGYRMVYAFRFILPVIALIGAVVGSALFIYLLSAAGRTNEEEEPVLSVMGEVPSDILFFVLGTIWMAVLSMVLDRNCHNLSDYVVMFLGVAVLFAILILTSMLFAEKVKTKTLWTNTICYRLGKYVKALGRILYKGLQLFGKFLMALPLIPVSATAFVVVALLELLIFRLWMPGEMHDLMTFWIIEKLTLGPVFFYVVFTLRKLQAGSEALVSGNASYKVDTKFMVWHFKKHGENLNRLAEGISKAVEERMRSERMKTELITNVSHDIKTPLTSIINYTDLICKEPTDNEKIKEYSEVLLRQATRLKKLTENLVDASKAATGSMEVNLVPCEVGVLLTQAVGEFEQRLEEKGITLVTKSPEEPVNIMADSKLIWRVFDNLMNNICKYAQDHTRVYLSVEKKEGKAIISFKNISSYELDITADELMERFVRGDKSRHTEGNGLGLSIAKSLTDLQKGEMELSVDGDLFKVVLTFDAL